MLVLVVVQGNFSGSFEKKEYKAAKSSKLRHVKGHRISPTSKGALFSKQNVAAITKYVPASLFEFPLVARCKASNYSNVATVSAQAINLW